MGILTRRGRRGDAGREASAPETVLTLAVLLAAGVSAARAWQHLAEAGDAGARRVCDARDEGMPLPAAIAALGGAWTDVAAAWSVATDVGAPLADSLRGIASSLRDAQEAADDVRVALAEPAGTAKLMGWLPLVAIVLSVLLGFDAVGVLFTQPLGIACLVAGGALMLAARRWNAALVRRATEAGGVPGLHAELLAIGLSGGVSIERARAVTVAARGGDEKATDAATDAVLALSRTAGVPAVELLRAQAALARHRARVDGRLRAARLSSRLLLPLGVCTLPAFLLLGVAPMLLSVMSSTDLSLF